jgi:hypothetical protein
MPKYLVTLDNGRTGCVEAASGSEIWQVGEASDGHKVARVEEIEGEAYPRASAPAAETQIEKELDEVEQ